jgi:hypothetical protein
MDDRATRLVVMSYPVSRMTFVPDTCHNAEESVPRLLLPGLTLESDFPTTTQFLAAFRAASSPTSVRQAAELRSFEN